MPEEKTEHSSENQFPIVGIGASAGGLAAFEAFFSGIPADKQPDMAFVLVQHLAPDHKSLLADLIRRLTDMHMKVYEVEDGMVVLPNCVYIIPPNYNLSLSQGALQLEKPTAPRGQRLPIDFFFRSLAQDQHERAICIVLSGTGSDGTLGVRAVKEEGGMVMVQDPDSSDYDGMPRSVIATNLADYTLSPEKMPAQLMAYAAHHYGKSVLPVEATQVTEDVQKKIFSLLRNQTGHDFSQYKPSTINRRIERRMAVHQTDTLEEYVKYMQQTPQEVEALFRDLLIGVTSFFRDPEAFEALEKHVEALFSNRPPEIPLRIWVPGCSTGEEAYSLAILISEYQEKMKRNDQIHIFATDIDQRAIATARAGIYPAGIATDISEERLARHFTPEPNEAHGTNRTNGSPSFYRVRKNIRDLLIFSEQSVVKDPPFSRIDLISCRNLLIYMGSDMQKKLIPLFHYALNTGGILFLGTSESVGEFSEMFSHMDRKHKIYQRKENNPLTNKDIVRQYLPPAAVADERASHPSKGKRANTTEPTLRYLTDQGLLQHMNLAGALVNERGDLLYLHGQSGKYLEPAPGEFDRNIIRMAREGLKRPLTTALHKVAASKETARHQGLKVKINGDFTMVNMTIRSVFTKTLSSEKESLYLIILEEAPEPMPVIDQCTVKEMAHDPENDLRNARLKQELQEMEEYLQATNEELETSNEELKSSNEEMQSVNEELQSTNEELETSKEELQSMVEELATVNAELQNKVTDLSRVNSDMNNLLAGTGIATVFVDHQLRIMRFTPTATQIINLILSDVGRPVGHIVNNLMGYDSLVEDTRAVLDTLVPKEVEVQSIEGNQYTMYIQPYRTLENVIEGAVLTFVNRK
ncbi:chemotaxis protein CheB [Anoxynatronum buryatiense]|uniref:protein-glutamate O-methyltransferase n=1 Tax=Anoxynatronum buryatiense TaxID=489973 RepID=A0AA45WV46_9CLOT|nr:chemotaxis protein CheB [Anoxynatronum buryatiense]SMP51144.1 two-component system, chemotaxis family, CheB/CheR fusion protein [Anoxynatronum buryatiense]